MPKHSNFTSNNLIICIVSVKIKARKVTVKGPKGEITKDLSHMPIEMKCMKL